MVVAQIVTMAPAASGLHHCADVVSLPALRNGVYALAFGAIACASSANDTVPATSYERP